MKRKRDTGAEETKAKPAKKEKAKAEESLEAKAAEQEDDPVNTTATKADKEAETEAEETEAEETETEETVVEARYLSGDTVKLKNCACVRQVMARVAKTNGRFAHEVAVIQPDTGQTLEHYDDAPRISYVVLRAEDDHVDFEEIIFSMGSHASIHDVRSCASLLDIMRRHFGICENIPLLDVARTDDPVAVKTLLAAGVRETRIAEPWQSALVAAARCGRAENVKILLGAFDYSDLPKGDVGEAIAGGANRRSAETVKALLTLQPHKKDLTKALIWAVDENATDVAKILLDAGASASCVDQWGCSLLTVAKRWNVRSELIDLLSQRTTERHPDKLHGCVCGEAGNFGSYF